MVWRARAHAVIGGMVAAVLGFAAPVGAADFCVTPATGCDAGQLPTLQAAFDAAAGSTGPDTVRLPPGLVAGPARYDVPNADNTLSVVGAGRDATTIVSSAREYALFARPGGVLSDLTVRQPDGAPIDQWGTFFDGDAERVAAISTDFTSPFYVFGTIRDAVVSGPSYVRAGVAIEDSRLRSPLAVGTSVMTVRRVRVEAPTPIYGQPRTLRVFSSLFVSTTPGSAVAAFSPSPVPDSQSSFLLSNVTLIGAGGSCTGLAVSGDNTYRAPDDDAVTDAVLANSIVRGCPTSVSRDSGGGNRTANLTIFNSDLDLSPAAVVQRGRGTLTAGPADGNIDSDPLFVAIPGFPQVPRAGSPVIDRGFANLVSPQESATDVNGNPRVVDGDGNGVAVRDMGAFEYQRRAPVVSATASKTTAAVGEAVAFGGSATDPDPGDSVTGFLWSFDDGVTSGGSLAGHAFRAPGVHTATLTAVDDAGVAGSATVSVTVTVTGTGDRGRGAVRGVTLTRSRFRAASRGASVARRRRRAAPVGTQVALSLSAPATVALTVERRANGRRTGRPRRCAAPTRRNRGANACVRWVALRGAVTRPSGAPALFVFSGRWNGRKLSPGRYRLVARAGTTPARAAAFRIVR